MKHLHLPRFPLVLAAFTLVVAVGSSVAHAGLLYADNFDRATGATVGSTSTSGYAWVETGTETNTVGIGSNGGNNALWIRNTGDQSDAAAYVDDDLNHVQDYTLAFTLDLTLIQQNGNLALSPRSQGTTADDAAAHWYFDTNTNLSGSGSADLYFNHTLVASDVLPLSTTVDVLFTVNGDNATLTLTSGVTPLINDTRNLGSLYNNAAPDHILLAFNNTGGSSRGMNAYIDNLAVTIIPVPAALPAGLGLLAIGLIPRRRRD